MSDGTEAEMVMSIGVSERDGGFLFWWDTPEGHYERGPFKRDVAMDLYRSARQKADSLGLEFLLITGSGTA